VSRFFVAASIRVGNIAPPQHKKALKDVRLWGSAQNETKNRKGIV